MRKSAVRARFILLVLALAAMGTAIAAIIWNFQRQTRDLRAKLANIDTESGQIASQFKDRFRDVTNARLHYAVTHDPNVWKHFLDANQALSEWIERRNQEPGTDEERSILSRVKDAYAQYHRTIGAIPGEPNATTPVADSLAAYTRVRAESQHLFDLGESLANAHYRSRDRLVTETRQRLSRLQASVLALVGVLFILGALLGIVAYRDMIAPLRVRLVESQSLVERQEKLASLGMLAAGVAHEIRNPLTAIKAALFIQQKRFKPGSPEHGDAELVQREISRLERIVNDFLRFARPAEPAVVTVPAADLLREVEQFFAPQLARTGITLSVDDTPACPVQVDPAQMKQVLINLVQNAIDSIGATGTITLRARRGRKTISDVEQDVIILEVADTGAGIPADVGKRLFDPFFTTKDNGTGLGLSIAARIVEKHHGALQYQTQVNRGTTFGVVLPEVVA
jgi:signal transduction histidine kinase